MAMDEALLRDAGSSHALPVLRFYTWSPPAVSLGRFQDAERAVNAEACRRRGIDIVRRITGGRAVLHKDELTYSIAAPVSNGLFPNDVLGTYKVIAAGLVAGLRCLGIPADMAVRHEQQPGMVKSKQHEPACFASPSWYEIVVRGRKIVGSAQRRVNGAFLQHGSILIGYDPDIEADVIHGKGSKDAVTSINAELGREVKLEEVKSAIRDGFAGSFDIFFSNR